MNVQAQIECAGGVSECSHGDVVDARAGYAGNGVEVDATTCLDLCSAGNLGYSRSQVGQRKIVEHDDVNATGKQVNLKVVVDPSVIGGLVATVGDTVIDGSVRTRLDQVKSRL